jgi:magnesium-dependent phosphatase-1
MKVYFFDCDETLWHTETKDYVSSVDSTFTKTGELTVRRDADELLFRLNPEVPAIFNKIEIGGNKIGILSDNKPEPVRELLKLFGLWEFVSPELFAVKLWDGYCPKHEMLQEALQNLTEKPEAVSWYDDKDYSQEAAQIAVDFVRVDVKLEV